MGDYMNLDEITYVVFDLETTGLYVNEGEEIIEIGAVKVKNNKIVSQFDELIKPTKPISEKISQITNITNEMVENKFNEETVLKEFISWIGTNDVVLVAHNANFDLSFVRACFLKYNLGILNYDVIDTLGLSRFLTPGEKYHNLTCLMERYNVIWDENKHHRADYDALGTSYVLYKMIDKLKEKNIYTMEDIKLIPRILLNQKINDCEK